MLPPELLELKVFISYTHKDTQWLERLQTHLKPLVREHSIDIWDDTEIQPGQRWEAEIDSALESAKVALLLVTANFLASDFISKTELPRLLSASERGEVVILPVIVSASQFLDMPGLREIQTVNNPGEPVDTLQRGDQERIFARVSQAIRRLLELG